MKTVTIPPVRNAERQATVSVPAVPAASASGEDTGLRTPLFVPEAQLYYWTLAWQAGEAEALRDIAAGKVRRFESGFDAAAWLLADEE